MQQRLRGWIKSAKYWHLVIAFFAGIALVSILWTASAIGARACWPGGAACLSSFEESAPLVVALGFAAAALIAWFFGQAGWGSVFLLLVSGSLAAGMLTEITKSADQPGRWFYLLLAWLAPITFQFHHSLLDRPLRRLGKAALALLYVYAAATSLPLLRWTAIPLGNADWFEVLRLIVRLGLILSLALGWLLLLREYRQGSSLEVQRRIRLVVFGTLVAFAPFVFLSYIPDTLRIADQVPYEATFPFLLISPLTYLYSIFRRRLARSDVFFSRAAVYYLALTLFLSGFLIAVAVLNRFVVGLTDRWPVASAALSVALVILFVPLKRALEKFLIWVLYGREIGYARVVGELADALSMTLDRETLRRLLVEELPRSLHLARCALYLSDAGGNFALLGAMPASGDAPPEVLPGSSQLATWLAANTRVLPQRRIVGTGKELSFSTEVCALVDLNWSYWLPLVSANALRGLLLIARAPDEDYLTREEEQILATVARQAAVAIHNLTLMEEVRDSREELALAHRRLLLGRERDQRRLARDLHDGALQSLIGMTYQVAAQRKSLDNGHTLESQAEGLDAIRQRGIEIIYQLRATLGEMRPAGLVELGLGAALESYARGLEQEAGSPKIRKEFHGNLKRLPEPISTCLYRVAQEALRNAVQHAHAKRVQLRLDACDDVLELIVQDDGCGFRVPDRLGEMTRRNHFGLVGMGEWVESAGGKLEIESAAGAGTRVQVRVSMKM